MGKDELDPRAAIRWAQQNPVAWLESCFRVRLWGIQRELVESFRDNKMTVAPSCNGSGKTFTAAHAALWALYAHPNCKVITSATSWAQVETALWGELRQAWATQKMPLGGPEPLKTSLELGPTWSCRGLSTDDPVRMQGQHATGGVWVILDEADGIPDGIWEAIRGNMSTSDCHLLAILNPTDPQSYASRLCRNPDRANVVRISAFDTPNFTRFGITIDDFRTNTWRQKITGPLPNPYLITPEWAFDSYQDDGEDSPFFQARVLAQYPDVSDDALIKPSWVMRAQDLWKTTLPKNEEKFVTIGADIARYGDDKTVIAVRRGQRVRIVDSRGMLDSEGAAELVLRHEALEHMESGNHQKDRPWIFMDVAGVGAGVYDLLKKTTQVTAVDNATRAEDPGRFVNRRAENFWNFREQLRKGELHLDPTDKQSAAELLAIKFQVQRGKVQIEEKANIKQRLKKSPDRADALVLASCAGIGSANTASAFIDAMGLT